MYYGAQHCSLALPAAAIAAELIPRPVTRCVHPAMIRGEWRSADGCILTVITTLPANPSEYAAWWGAIVATAAFLGSVYRAIRSGPRVERERQAADALLSSERAHGDNIYISVRTLNLRSVNLRGSRTKLNTILCR